MHQVGANRQLSSNPEPAMTHPYLLTAPRTALAVAVTGFLLSARRDALAAYRARCGSHPSECAEDGQHAG
jgi:hypothetical protein